MKKFILLPLLLLLIGSVRAQYVSIPDSSLLSWLETNYSVCMVGNQLNTQCPDVLGATYLNPQVDSDITGLQYFTSVQTLQLFNVNGSTAISTLAGNYPPNLTELDILSSHMAYIPGNLPATLQYMTVSNLSLYQLPALPSSIHYLDIGYNYLTSSSLVFTSGWPATLDTLVVDGNDFQGISFPPLPEGISYFSAGSSGFTTPPILPATLTYLDLGSCFISFADTFFPMPPNLNYLDLSYDYFPNDTLPALPANLQTFFANGSQLIKCPALPASLQNLSLEFDSITSFATFPAGLSYLECSYNANTTLPALPVSLLTLECGGRFFTSLPPLPASLTYLACNQSPITSIPALPSSLLYLQITFDPALTSLPSPLPGGLKELEVNYDSALSCLPPLPLTLNTFSWPVTSITCLPNYLAITGSPAINTVPLCDAASGCQPNWNISGSVYFNSLGSCIHNPVEPFLQPVKMQLWQGDTLVQQVYAPGVYSFKTNFDSYTVQVDTNSVPFEFDCSSASSVTVSPADSLQVVNFEAHCKTGFDLGVNYITNSSVFFPGQTTILNISAGDVLLNQYGLSCNTGGLSGQVQAIISGPAIYSGVASGVPTTTSVSGDTITWMVADFSQGNGRYDILVQTDATARGGEIVCVDVNVTPVAGDNNPANNDVEQCYTVHNSFDPNYKEVSPVSELPYPYSDWLTYTVHFQNTGTAAAHNITITDTLDANIDPTSFQLLTYSYEPTVQISGRYVTFYFNQILLPDSAANPQGSMGYVQYRVKLLATPGIGTNISNTAYVYFDFNAPVATNSTANTITSTAGIRNISSAANVIIYPNPSTGSWQLTVGNELLGSTLEVFDEQGRLVFHSAISNQNSEIKFEAASGVYFLRISNENVSAVRKLVRL